MKRITTLLTIITFFAASTITQAQLSVGARIGINLSDQLSKSKGGENFDYEGLAGLSIAIPLEIGLTERFSVQPELTFIQKGAGLSFTLLGVEVTNNSVYNYLALPLLVKYKFINSDAFKMYAVVGPGFGYALGGNTGTSTTKTKIDFDADTYKDFERFETNLNFGLGFGFTTESGDIVLDLRYRYGLSDLDKSDDFVTKNHSIGLSVGYMYRLGE
ncbi:MAG: porin family protein [Saprospiraceae bacterium]